MPKQTEKLGDWRVFKTAEAVAVHAAEWLCSACGRNGEIAICLSGGSTPRRLYQHILKCYLEYYNAVRTHLSWARMHPFAGTSSMPGASKCGLCLVDCTISTGGFDLW